MNEFIRFYLGDISIVESSKCGKYYEKWLMKAKMYVNPNIDFKFISYNHPFVAHYFENVHFQVYVIQNVDSIITFVSQYNHGYFRPVCTSTIQFI